MGPGIETHPGRLRIVTLCAPSHTQLLEVHERPPGGKFAGANICEIVVGRQFAPQPYRTGGVDIWRFTIYWLSVERPNERDEAA